MMEKEQKLLDRIIDIFAQKFDKNAILCGGMVLRILGSRRLTNDLTDADIEKELSVYLPPDEIIGLADMFRAAFASL